MLIVKKYGGKILSSIPKMKQLAQRIANQSKDGTKILIVVSAMGDQTEKYIDLVKEIKKKSSSDFNLSDDSMKFYDKLEDLNSMAQHAEYINRREYESLLSYGESVCASLFTMCLCVAGCDAVSYTGWQSRILTKNTNTGVRIESIDDDLILNDLNKKKVVVITGFQGVDENNNITILDRGGSDFSAIFLAKYLSADKCCIYKDVGGIYTKDPKIYNTNSLIKNITYNKMIKMCKKGSKVLQLQSVLFAMENDVVIHIMNPETEECGTIISDNKYSSNFILKKAC